MANAIEQRSTNNLMEQITIDRDFLEHLLSCLANQKFISEGPQNGDSLAAGKDEYEAIQKRNQRVIDEAYEKGWEILSNASTSAASAPTQN